MNQWFNITLVSSTVKLYLNGFSFLSGGFYFKKTINGFKQIESYFRDSYK